MIGRRAAAGLSLLCALLFCAFAAQSASAATKGTTAFTCVPGTGAAGFEDKHCDKATSEKSKVKFVHEAIALGVETDVTGSNKFTANETKDHTTAVLHTVKAGIEVKLTCTEVHTEGTVTNTLKEPETHRVKITKTKIVYNKCEVSKPVGKCAVKQPIEAKAEGESWESGEEMGVEFKAEEGKPFTEITLENLGETKCALAGTYPIEGSVIGTPGGKPSGNGATLQFTSEASMQKLTFGGSAAQYTGIETIEMKTNPATEGNAITLTTVK